MEKWYHFPSKSTQSCYNSMHTCYILVNQHLTRGCRPYLFPQLAVVLAGCPLWAGSTWYCQHPVMGVYEVATNTLIKGLTHGCNEAMWSQTQGESSIIKLIISALSMMSVVSSHCANTHINQTWLFITYIRNTMCGNHTIIVSKHDVICIMHSACAFTTWHTVLVRLCVVMQW